jgi:lysophospholipase L1-like esterase
MTTTLAKIDPNFALANVTDPLDWYDMADLPTEGQGWPGEAPGRYGRLPERFKSLAREPVWHLGQMSAGLAIRFVTDSTDICVSWDITGPALAMNHMPATGMSGIDLYVRSGGRWRWAGITRPDGNEGNRTFTQWLLQGASAQKREYMMYLPLYNSVSGVRVGVRPGSHFAPAAPRPQGQDVPMCFYGTSILQGGCASRPGMAYPAIISRYLDLPHINLGFSGNAKMEPDMAKLLAELDPCVFVLDPLPNNTKDEIIERGRNLVETIRKARPDTPIVMVENIIYQQGHIVGARYDRYTSSNKAWLAIYDQLILEGDQNLYYIPCTDLLGDDDEGTVDGTHATDLGFYRMAQAITPYLQSILGR